MENIDNICFEEAKQGLLNLCDNTNELYYFLSPGRIELLGNHTDHNNGKVLTSSIDLYIYACCTKRDDNKIVLLSKDHEIIEIDINELINNIDNEEYINKLKVNGKSISIVYGVLYRLIKLGYKVGGFNCYCVSTIPESAGVSSSASFESLVCEILSYFYNEDKISKLEIAKIAKYSENEFFGKPCGLLDQCAVNFGGVNYIDFNDPSNPIVKKLDNTNINDDYNFVLIKIGSHASLTKYYTSIKKNMENIAKHYNKQVLREVNKEDIYNDRNVLTSNYGLLAYNRALHFVNENDRVEEAYSYLEKCSSTKEYQKSFLLCLRESGKSSYYLLRNCYCENEAEDLPKGIKYCNALDRDAYVRVHGGGFAGTILMVINNDNLDKDLNELINYFGISNIRKVNLSNNGTSFYKKELLK